MQTRDYLDAFNFAVAQPEVDPAKIVYWGSSMSGGNAICAAAINKSIAGAILQVPFVSGESIARLPGMTTSLLLQNRDPSVTDRSSATMPIFPSSLEELASGASKAVLKDPGAIPFTEEMQHRGMEWSKFCTVQSLTYTLLHEPIVDIHRISPTPMLMIVADSDVTTQTHLQLEAFEKALQPKKLEILKGSGHFEPYYGETFEQNIQAQLNFLDEILS